MLKKSLIIGSSLIILASCGVNKNEKPEDVLLKNQVSLIETFEKLSKKSASIGNEIGNMKIDVKSKDGDLDFNISYDLNFDNKEEKISGDINIDVDLKSQKESLKGNLALSTILKDRIFYTKIKNLDFDIPGNNKIGFIKMMVSSYIGKWIEIDLNKYLDENDFSFSYLNFKNTLDIYKKTVILTLVKENKDKENYNYDVVLNENGIIKIYEELLKKGDSDSKLSEYDIAEMKKGFQEIKFSGNMKINPQNKNYFTFSGSIGEVNLNISNSKKSIVLKADWEGNTILLTLDKVLTGLKGNISFSEGEINILKGNFDLTMSKNKVILVGILDMENNVSIKFELNSEIEPKKEIKIELPKDSMKLEELIGGFMGAAMGGIDTNGNLDKPFELNYENKIDTEELDNISVNNGEEINSDEIKEVMAEIEGISELAEIEELLK